MTWILKDQRVVSGIDPDTSNPSYEELKAYLQWLVGTYLVSRGYETFINDSDANSWYYGVRKDWYNKFGVNITTSYVNHFQTSFNQNDLYTWDLGSNDPTVGIDQKVLASSNNSLMYWIANRKGPQTMQVWESDQDSSSWLWRRVEPPTGSYTSNFFGIHYPDNCYTQLKNYGDDVWKYFVDELGIDLCVQIRAASAVSTFQIAPLQYDGTTTGVLTDRWGENSSIRILEPADVNGDIFYYCQTPISNTFTGRSNQSYSGNYKFGDNYYMSISSPTTGALMFGTGSIDPSNPLG